MKGRKTPRQMDWNGCNGGITRIVAGPGSIKKRQTTWWELDQAAHLSRLHFRNKREARYFRAEFTSGVITGNHQLLLDYQEFWEEVSFLGCVGNAGRVVLDIHAAIDKLSRGWRSAREYLNELMPTETLLSSGGGVLCSAPAPYSQAIARICGTAGLDVNVRPLARRSERVCVAVFDRSFVVAEEFAIEGLR